MSKTDKMFEDLGFSESKIKIYADYTLQSTSCIYSKEYYDNGVCFETTIEFDLSTKMVDIVTRTNEGRRATNLSTRLHLAIHEKMKELGWIE